MPFCGTLYYQAKVNFATVQVLLKIFFGCDNQKEVEHQIFDINYDHQENLMIFI